MQRKQKKKKKTNGPSSFVARQEKKVNAEVEAEWDAKVRSGEKGG